MSTKKPSPPAELLSQKLAARPQGTKCVLALDPDRLVDWSPRMTDRKGREWETVIYRGDDVVTRRAWRRASSGNRPVCLVLARAEGDHSRLDASGLADLASRAEGEII